MFAKTRGEVKLARLPVLKALRAAGPGLCG